VDKALRALTYERSKGWCEACGLPISEDDFDWSHRLSKAHGGKYEIQNGMAVHSKCHHEQIESQPYTARLKGWRVPSQGNPAEVPILLYGKSLIFLEPDGSYRKPFNA